MFEKMQEQEQNQEHDIVEGIISEVWSIIKEEQEPHVEQENIREYLNNSPEAKKIWQEYSKSDFSDEKKQKLIKELVNIYEEMEAPAMN